MNKPSFKVLVVDDDFLSQLVAKLLLEQLGCEVDIAKSEEEIFEKTDALQYGLIFMDIGLGKSSGFTITEKIKKFSAKNTHTPIIALTAHHASEYQEQAKAVGIAEFITKPLEKCRIRDLLAKYHN